MSSPEPEVPKSRFDELLSTLNDAATVDERDLLKALYLIGVTLEEVRDRLEGLGDMAADLAPGYEP